MKRTIAVALVSFAALTACTQGGQPGATGVTGRTPAASPASVCPLATPLDPGPDARAAATAAAVAEVPKRYPPHIDTTGFQVSNAYLADPSSGFGSIAFGLCGTAIGQRTWVVELFFPKMLPSADLSAGQLFLSRFPDGWKVWFQYH